MYKQTDDFSFLIIILLNFISQVFPTVAKSQEVLKGKSFVTLHYHACEKYVNNNGCDIYDFSELTFKEDSVGIKHSTKYYCTKIDDEQSLSQTTIKKYIWKSKNNILKIENENILNEFEYKDSRLINTQNPNLIFIEQVDSVIQSHFCGDMRAGVSISISSDSTELNEYLRGKNVCHIKVNTSFNTWYELNQDLKLSNFKKIISKSSEQIYDGCDNTTIIYSNSTILSSLNPEENLDLKLQNPFFEKLNAIEAILHLSCNRNK